MVLAAAIVIVAIWTAVLSVKVSKLKKLVMMEQERSADLARRLAFQGRRRSGAPSSGAAAAVSPSGMPIEQEALDVVPRDIAEAERTKKQKSHKGKPTIPFGTNKEAQNRAQQAYAELVDEDDFDPDSIDFDKVEGLRRPNMAAMPANANPVRPVAGVAAHGAHQQMHTREPRLRADARALEKQKTGRMPTVSARQATSETRASFDRVNEELRSRNGASGAWVEEDARRVVERHERAAKRQRLSERRQHEQLRRQAASIVAEHHRQMNAEA